MTHTAEYYVRMSVSLSGSRGTQLQSLLQQMMCNNIVMFYSLRIFAVFSVVISISGSVKYSDATHRPFSDPVRKNRNFVI